MLHAFVEVRRKFFPLIGLSFVVGFSATLLGGVFPFGNFVVQTFLLPSAVVVLMLEKPGLGVITAFRTGLSLTGDSLATIFGVDVVSAGAVAGLYAVLIKARMSNTVSPVFFTFANLVSFFLVLPSAVALILGVVLTSFYYDRRMRTTAPRVVA